MKTNAEKFGKIITEQKERGNLSESKRQGLPVFCLDSWGLMVSTWQHLWQQSLCLPEALSPRGFCAGPIHRTVIYTFIGSHLVLIKSSTHQFVSPCSANEKCGTGSESSRFKSQLIVPLLREGPRGRLLGLLRPPHLSICLLKMWSRGHAVSNASK